MGTSGGGGMNCPHCGNDKHRVSECRSHEDGLLRRRLCQGCGRIFTSIERVAVYAGRHVGYLEPVQGPPVLRVVEPQPEAQPEAEVKPAAKAKARTTRFMPTEAPAMVTPAARPLLLQWWTESRRSKHGSSATWTQAAWEASCSRVANLPPSQQIELCRQGVEFGWQALKPDYVGSSAKPSVVPTAGPPLPKDPAMLAALDSWPSTAS